MKRLSSLIMGVAFVAAIGGALGLKVNTSPKFITNLQLTNSICSPSSTNCKLTGAVACAANIYLDNTSHTCVQLAPRKDF